MSMITAFEPIDIEYRRQVMGETWGHLAPKRNKKYKVKFWFARSVYNRQGTVIIKSESELPSSPWEYDAIHEMLGEFNLNDGSLYIWEGTFKNYKWTGELAEMPL